MVEWDKWIDGEHVCVLNLNMSWHKLHQCTQRTRTLAPKHILLSYTISLFSPLPHSSLVPEAHVCHLSTDNDLIPKDHPSTPIPVASNSQSLKPFPNSLVSFFISLPLACQWFDFMSGVCRKLMRSLQKARLVSMQFIVLHTKWYKPARFEWTHESFRIFMIAACILLKKQGAI